MMLSASQRKMIYSGLWVLDGALLVCAQQNLFAAAPKVALCMLATTSFLTAFMHAWNSPDAPVLPALEQAAPALLAKPVDGAK